MRLTAPKCVLACLCAHRSDGWMNPLSVCAEKKAVWPPCSLSAAAHTPFKHTPTHIHTELYSFLRCSDAWISTFVHARRTRSQATEPEETCAAYWPDCEKSKGTQFKHEPRNKRTWLLYLHTLTHTYTHNSFLSSQAGTCFWNISQLSFRLLKNHVIDRDIYWNSANIFSLFVHF